MELLNSNIEFKQDFINIVLVYFEVREAFLLETSNHINSYTPEESLSIIKDFIIKLQEKYSLSNSMYMTYDRLSDEDFPRYIITNKPLQKAPTNDKQLGKLLGFKCYGHEEYGNELIDRISGEIFAEDIVSDSKHEKLEYTKHEHKGDTKDEYTKSVWKEQIYVEVCEIVKTNIDELKLHLHKKCLLWNNIFDKLNIPVKFEYKTDIVVGTQTLSKNINSIEYVIKNRELYIDYFDNFSSDYIRDYVQSLFKEITVDDTVIDKEDLKFNDKQKNIHRIIKNLFYVCFEDKTSDSIFSFATENKQKDIIKHITTPKVIYSSKRDAVKDKVLKRIIQ